MSEPAPAIGVIGIGNMGLAMALRLRELGCAVGVRDIDPAREATARAHGARVFATPAALAAQGGVVIVAVVDAAQVEAVLFAPDGAVAGLPRGVCVVLCPTIGPDRTEDFAARLAERGIDWIDAPMSGGPARARDGTMSLMAACDDAVFARWRGVLERLSSSVFRVGTRAGDGARVKLVNNLLAAVNLAGAAEALALAERVGLDPARVQAVIERSSGQSWIGSDRMPRALAGDLAPRAHTTLLRKDAALAIAMARAAGIDVALGGRAAAVFEAACEAGWGSFDDASLLPFARGRRAGREAAASAAVRGAPAPRPAVVSTRDEAAPDGVEAASDRVEPALDLATAARYAACVLQSLETAYPHALQHAMRDAADRPLPDELHPIFCGSFDWHSSVHMQASLVRLLRIVPALPQRAAALEHFANRFSVAAAARECRYLSEHPAFERPYGWAWLMRLHDELRALAAVEPAAQEWVGILDPLVAVARRHWLDHLSIAPRPQRAGIHSNSAFAMILALEHARGRDDAPFAAALVAAARRWFEADTRYPARYEPSANDFLSAGLCTAVLMGIALDAPAFARWWQAYRPDDAEFAHWLAPAPVGSRSDAQLVHADGLNLSRAWCLGRLAAALPEERAQFGAARRAHLDAALAHVVDGDFAATHWLVSFALLALTDADGAGPGAPDDADGAGP